MDSLISVIIPAYNAEKYVKRCVQSLLEQSYHNLEIIIVDDGSTDKTSAICNQIIKESDKVKLYVKENGGAASARNYGLGKALGEYIAFVDVDDTVFKDYIEYMYRLLMQHGADVSMCSCYKMRPDEKMPQNFSDGNIYELNQEESLKNLFYRKGITGYPVLKLWKKEIIKDASFPEDMLYGEDFVFVYEMLKRCSKIVYGEHIAYIYYQNLGSVDHSENYAQLMHSWDVYSKQMENDVRQRFPILQKALVAKNYISAVNFYNRVHKMKGNSSFKNDLRIYIKKHGMEVFRDRECKGSNRVLGLVGGISPILLSWLVRFFFCIRRVFHIELRKAV